MFRQLLIVTFIGVALGAPSNKIDGKLSQIVNAGGSANVVVSFREDTAQIIRKIETMKFSNRAEKITAMMTHLKSITEKSQRNALNILKTHKIRHESLWINNRLYINVADLELINAIASLSEVTEIRKQFTVRVDDPIIPVKSSTLAVWNIEKVEADQAWALPGGNNGQGIVVANIDTGVRYTHEALRNNFRGSYGWFDPYHRTAHPIDENGHGTHTMGTIAGSNGIGVAPGAQWIACRGFYVSDDNEATLAACGQWILCPTLTNGTEPNCSKAPNVVSNSWGEGQGNTWYNPIINAWRSAGIIPVFAHGNSGPNCSSVLSPGDSTDVIGVGSTTAADEVSVFSSRGPTYWGDIKPDVTAPGSEVISATHLSDTDYGPGFGTSMACPHVAGAVAVLLSQNPNLTYDQVKNYLQDHADRDLGPADTCGGTPPTVFPNNIYGYGRINVRRALIAAISGDNSTKIN